MSNVTPIGEAKARKRAAGRRPPPPSWFNGAQTDAKGVPLGNLFNAMLALRGAPELDGAFGLDEMAGAPMVLRPLPGRLPEEAIPWTRPVKVTDVHVSQAQEWLQGEGLTKISKDVLHQAVDLRASECAFHPVRDFLNGLTWDGVDRLGEWFPTYLGTDATPYTAEIGRMMLVGMVARVMRPGCKLDHMVVLEGEQGAMKSSACRILGGTWFSDSLPDVSAGKDVAQHLPGNWLIEIGELSAMSKADSNHLKQFISRQVEKYRPSYGRREIEQPRQCVFIGTTNAKVYLKDETGGRRFWPVVVGQIAIDALKRDRDALFAEAVWRFRQGERWWPDQGFERDVIKSEQEARFDTDVWEDAIRNHLVGRSSILIGDIAKTALSMDTGRIGRAEQNRITKVLESLGWVRGKPTMHGKPWVRGGALL